MRILVQLLCLLTLWHTQNDMKRAGPLFEFAGIDGKAELLAWLKSDVGIMLWDGAALPEHMPMADRLLFLLSWNDETYRRINAQFKEVHW